MLDGLMYQIPDGVLNEFYEIHFAQMVDAHIPCYVHHLSVSIKINEETIAKTKELSLRYLSASLQSTLVLELFNRHKRPNGWVLISSDEDQCFGVLCIQKSTNTNAMVCVFIQIAFQIMSTRSTPPRILVFPASLDLQRMQQQQTMWMTTNHRQSPPKRRHIQ